MSSNKPEKRKISRIEFLVHPFYELYNPKRKQKTGFSVKEFVHLAEKWKQRVKEIAADPDAIMVILKSGYEYWQEEVLSKKYYSKEEIKKIKKIEKEFYGFAEKRLERQGREKKSGSENRLFLGLEHKKFDEKFLGHDYMLDPKKFRDELKKRNMKISRWPTVWGYGGYYQNCLGIQFDALKKFFRKKCNLRFKTIESLYISKNRKHPTKIRFHTARAVKRFTKPSKKRKHKLPK